MTTLSSSLSEYTSAYYASFGMSFGSEELKDSDLKVPARLRGRLHQYSIDHGLLCYSTDTEDILVLLFHMMRN